MDKITTGASLNPTAEVRADVGKIIVSVEAGYYEIYVDKKMRQPALNNGQAHEYPAEPGEHRIGVYSAGRFVLDQMITVPAEEPEKPALHETMTIKTETIKMLIDELRDLALFLEDLLPKPETKPEE